MSGCPSLLPYQRPAADVLEHALLKHNAALDASDTGTGKTYIACEVLRRLGRVPFIITPKATVTPWRRCLASFGLSGEVINFEKLRAGNTRYLSKGKTPLTVVWRLPANVQAVVDEAHRASGMSSWNGAMVGFLKAYAIPTLLLSATLAESPLKMKATGYLLNLHRYRDFDHWLYANGCYKDDFRRWRFNPSAESLKKLADLHRHIFPEYGYRVRIADLGDQFPECLTYAEAYDVGTETAKKIDEAYLDRPMVEDAITGGMRQMSAMEALLRGRQAAELAKLPVIFEMVDDLLEEGNSVVVFFNFRESFAAFCEQFPECAWIRGEQSNIIRQEQIDRFGRDETRVCVAMIQAGGVGVSLHDTRGEFPRVSIICPTFNAIELKQAMGRIHRATAKSKAVNRILFAAGTVEEKACDSTNLKLRNMAVILDGDLQAGLPYQVRTNEGVV